MPDVVMQSYTIYFSPTDYPGKYVIRRFDIVRGQTGPVPREAAIAESLAHARLAISLLNPGAVCFERSPGDDPNIVETWL